MNTNNGGVTNIDVLSVGALYIGGQRFRDVIQSLVSEDALDQQQITDLRNLITYLNTTALNQPWIVNNDNRNAVLKTLITAIETKLQNINTTGLTLESVLTDDNRNGVLKTATDALTTKLTNIDTTALTQSSVLTDDNRNSVLKTRIDGNDGSLSTLNNKTRYINQSTVGSNSANPKTANTFSVNVNTNPTGIHKGDLSIEAGFNLIRMKNDSTTLQDFNYNDNQMNIFSPNGMITTYSHLNRIQAQNKIEIGDFGINNSAAINIGGKAAQINIGAIDDPDVSPSANTVITIGKRTTLRNTQTYLQGNFYTTEARLENLNVTDVLTWGNAVAWAAGFVFTGVPYWLAWAGLSGLPNYRYSDCVKMANNYLTGGLTKNHSIETSNDLALKALTIVNTDLVSLSTPFDGLLNRLVFQAFAVHGSHSIGTIWGKVNMYVGSGEVELRNDGSVFDWAFKNAGNANQLLIKNLDVELIQCNGSSNDAKLTLGACNGNIDLITGSNGIRANATKVMEIKSNKQVLIGSNSAMVDNTYKVLVDATSHTNGIKVAKNGDSLLLNPTNVSSKSLTLQDSYAGTTTATLYKNGNGDLMWDGQAVAIGSIAASGGGLTYVISNPATATVTTPNFTPITNLTMSDAYTSAPLRTVTLSSYVVNTNYKLVEINGAVQKSTNPVLSGTYELNQFVNLTANANHTYYLYAKLYFSGLGPTPIIKTYTSPAGSGNTLTLTTPAILVPVNDVSITITSVIFPSVYVGGSSFGFSALVLTLINQAGTVLYTFPTVNANNDTTANRTFTPASPVTITQTSNITSLRFVLTNQNQTSTLNQASAQSATNASYTLDLTTIRMLLYDGTTNPTILAHNTAAIYALSIPLPAVPFVITDFQNPSLSLEQWFIQPTGNTTNHTVALQFNDGGLSHLHTSLALLPTTPNLATVMALGNSVGGNNLNMNNQTITNTGAITGWNVKSLTAGSGITTVDNGSGTWTITNTGIPITPTLSQVMTAGATANTNLNMSSNSITNVNAITAVTVNATNIPNWNVKQITGAGNITVSNNGAGTYLISSDNMGGHESSADDFAITAASANTARKPTWYGNVWIRRNDAMVNTNTCFDVYMSANGKIIAFAHKDSSDDTQRPIIYSTDFGTSYSSGNVSKNWVSICGTTMGEDIYAIQGRSASNGSVWPREIWRSNSRGATWFQNPSPPDFANSIPTRIRCSGDGKYQLVNDTRTGALGKLYQSNDYGATWTTRNITVNTSRVSYMAISASGQVQYLLISGTSELTTADQGNGGVYRSTDFGATFQYVYSTNANDILYHIACDATGRIVIVSNVQGVFVSRNYGDLWSAQISITGGNALSVSPNGNIIWVACTGVASTTAQLYYSDDYGRTFTAKNQTPDGTYLTTQYQAIATNNDGTILVGGGQFNFNSCRQFPTETNQITAGLGITATGSEGSLTLTTGFTGVPHSTYFGNLNFGAPGFLALPTTMNLLKYDYLLDFSITGLANNTWLYLRFNNDVGLYAWDSCLTFNPTVRASGGVSVACNYNKTDNGNNIYWLNGGMGGSTLQPIQMKATYKMSAIGNQTFVVSLEQCQPVSIFMAEDNIQPFYQVFATQIKYVYTSNNLTRWCPTHLGVLVAGTAFTNLNCCITQCIRSTVATNHVV
jgi:hypothetical protein